MKYVLILFFFLFSLNLTSNDDCTGVCEETVFNFGYFYDANDFYYAGTASQKSGTLSLCSYESHRSGAIWYKRRIKVSEGFTTQFSFSIPNGVAGESIQDESQPGADGFAFVIQNSTFSQVGGDGYKLGYDGIKNSIAIEFDLFENSGRIHPNMSTINDPNGNHIAVMSLGREENRSYHGGLNTFALNDEIIEILSDGTLYFVRINYNPDAETLSICLGDDEDNMVNVIELDNFVIDKYLDLSYGKAMVGFTASTGEGYQDHLIHSWSLCTPETTPSVDNEPCLVDCNKVIASYTTFINTKDFAFRGDAVNLGDSISVAANKWKSGALWYNKKLNVENSFLAEFSFSIPNGSQNNALSDGSQPGGDGFAFVIQNTNLDQLGIDGHLLGYDGIKNSIAIEFDLFENSARTDPKHDYMKDPNGNHIAVNSFGREENRSYHEHNTLGLNDEIPEILSDGTRYYIKILYSSVDRRLYVCMREDGFEYENILDIGDFDISQILDLDNGAAYVGFTASCGNATEGHMIHDWSWCIPAQCDDTQFEYPDFTIDTDLEYNGYARRVNNVVRLTPAAKNEAGSFWHKNYLPIDKGFSTEFTFRMMEATNGGAVESSYPGGDGLAFVIQNNSTESIGTGGYGLGYEGIPQSIAIEFDMFTNDDQSEHSRGDRNGNHISVHTGGILGNSAYHAQDFDLGTKWNMNEIRSDATVYWSKIIYSPGTLEIYLSTSRDYGAPVLVLNAFDISDYINLKDGSSALVGFTASTSEAYQSHDIRYWYFCPFEAPIIISVEDDEEVIPVDGHIYPNPASDQITINTGSMNLSRIVIYNNIGQVVFEDKIVGSATIDISSFSNGTYYIMMNANGNYKFEQFNKVK